MKHCPQKTIDNYSEVPFVSKRMETYSNIYEHEGSQEAIAYLFREIYYLELEAIESLQEQTELHLHIGDLEHAVASLKHQATAGSAHETEPAHALGSDDNPPQGHSS